MERKGLNLRPATQQLDHLAPNSPSKHSPSISRGASGLSSTSFESAEDIFVSYQSAEGENKTFFLHGKRILTLGRDETCDVCLSVPTVSRNHAQLRIDENGQAWIDSMSSGNPTKVNGERISTCCSLKPGDLIEVGGAAVWFGAEAPLKAPPSDSALLSRRLTPGDETMQPIHVDGNAGGSQPFTGDSSGAGLSGSDGDGFETASTLTPPHEGGCKAAASSDDEDEVIPAVASESSPFGSRLLSRKILGQRAAASRALDVSSSAPTLEKEPSDDAAQLDADVLPSTPDQESPGGAGEPADSEALGGAGHASEGGRLRVRAAYNRQMYSPSMGVSEEEQRALMEQHMAALQAAASSPACSNTLGSPTTPQQSLGTAGAGDDATPEPAPRLNSFMTRSWYNKQVYSPSMGATEEEIQSMRQEAAGGFEPQNASIEEGEGGEEAWGVSLVQEEGVGAGVAAK